MARLRMVLPILVATLVLAVSADWRLVGQERAASPRAGGTTNPAVSVQDALNRPFHFSFGKPTPLDEAARQIGRALNAPVIVDRAAIDRLGLKMDDEVQLELEGVRLKTGLKLLLDQLDLTYRVVPEDNLLIFTDREGSEEPLDRVLAQIKALHRDIHDLQDAVDEVRDTLSGDVEEGAKVRKPTIIEELPEAGGKPAKPKDAPHRGATPLRSKPGI